MSTPKEKKYDRFGMIASISIHALLLLIFFFLLAWQAPDPPIPEYGIVVNFGTDNAGSGRVQPKKPPVQAKKVKEKVQEEPKPQKQEPEEEAVEETPQKVQQEVVTETPKEAVEEAVTQPEPAPVVEKKKKKPQPKEEPEPKKKTPEKKPEPKKEPPKEKAPENKPTENNKPTSDSRGQSDKEPSRSNQGDRPQKTGDQGKPTGSLDSKALYGSQGGGGGSRLDLAGWNWDELPRPDDRSQESGRIVFEIKVDDQGEIISVRTIEKTVSPAVEKIYRDEVENLTFHKTADNTRPAPVSTGRITFIIKAN